MWIKCYKADKCIDFLVLFSAVLICTKLYSFSAVFKLDGQVMKVSDFLKSLLQHA